MIGENQILKQYIKQDPWLIIEEGFDPHNHEISESLCAIGNGHMGQRANFEEHYSGKHLQGSYMAGVYYPDKTRVGWWKNGYPEYFAKVLNSTNWIGLDLHFDGEQLDLAKALEVSEYRRVLNMKEGFLQRSFFAKLANGYEVAIEATRFVSFARKEIGALRYSIIPVNFSGQLKAKLYLDGDVMNKDANYDESFWDAVDQATSGDGGTVTTKTRKTGFVLTAAMAFRLYQNGDRLNPLTSTPFQREKYVAHEVTVDVKQGETTTIEKYAALVTSRDHGAERLVEVSTNLLTEAVQAGFDTLKQEHAEVWAQKWQESDIIIEGDVAAQQGIRFNIFHLNQTYTGEDERLNIGPKGFTGEKYGGSTYWDTEAYCLPFYLSTAPQEVARQLLVYRFRHLEKAKENARKLGFEKGALYPMVTMNGEESHNEWEITFEEIHRNGAIAYAIFNYVRYTGDTDYLGQYGFEVVAEIARFWAERVNWSEAKGKYVMLGVTGPNEYENNVNNNWYTNRIAAWTLEYALGVANFVQKSEPSRYADLVQKMGLSKAEYAKWWQIISDMYYPVDETLGVFLQQDGFLDKELIKVKELDPKHLPLNQNWSWDRILRSCFIKQADVLQGLYFLGDQYDLETKKRNFDFYEPMTVHESSLSPCVHSILACELGYKEKAYEMYLRTSRLDLDNYNNDTEDGLHITSMAGTWMSVVQGFGGLRVHEGKLVLNPFIPGHWTQFAFKVMFRGARLLVTVKQDGVSIVNETEVPVAVLVHGKELPVGANASVSA